MSHTPIEETEVYQRAYGLSNDIWSAAVRWDNFAKMTVGRQIVRCADSIPANLSEGDGRYSDGEALYLFTVSRGSLRETSYWVNAAKERKLLTTEQHTQFTSELDSIRRMLNALIDYRRKTKNQRAVREDRTAYEGVRDPHASRLTPHASVWESMDES